MKRLLFSMAIMFAFTITSQAQYGPGGDSGLGGGGGTVQPDLVVLSTTAPNTWSNITGATFQVTVRNNHNAAEAAASQLIVYYDLNLNNYPYDATHLVYIYGPTTTLLSIMADGYYEVTEANETNNTYTP